MSLNIQCQYRFGLTKSSDEEQPVRIIRQRQERLENMFVAISVYLKPLEEVNQVSAEHAAWIVRYYASGRFLASGRRMPPVGGVIIGRAESKEEFLSVLAGDPYQQHGIAKYEVFEFNPGPLPRRSSELVAFLSRSLHEESNEQG